MRSVNSARGLSRRAITATTLCVTSAAGVGGALAQTAPDQTSAAADPKTEQLTVTGVRPLINDKLPTGLQDAPLSVTVVDQQLLKAESVTRLQDALKNVPGITLNAGEGAARGDTVNLRGFSAFNDFFLDGIRDSAIYTRDSFDLESVEVLKGPSAVLFGRGSTGGVINQVSKAPTLAPLYAGTLQFGTNDSVRATADVDQPIGPSAAIRLNAMGEDSAVAGRDTVHNGRFGFAPSIALGIGEANSLTFSYLHQEENDIPDTGIPFIDGRPAPVSRSLFYGLNSDRFSTRDDVGTLRLKHDFNSNLSVTDTLRLADYEFLNRISAPNFGTSVPAAGTPLADIRVGRDDPSSQGSQTNLTNQTDVTARFETPWMHHILIAGYEISRQTSNIGRFNNPFNKNNNWVPMTPLLSPNGNEVAPNEGVTSQQNTIGNSTAAYLTDTISITPYVDLIGGVRYDRFAATYNQYTLTTGTTLHLDRTDYVTSPRAAIVIKPTETQSYYFSYGTSFDPSAEALALTTATAKLGPVKAETYEGGAKVAWLGGILNTTAAVFHTTVDNAQTNDPDNPSVTILAGNQRVNGLELGTSGYLTDKWEVFAGYTYLDAKTTASGTAAYVGKFLQNTARNAFNLFTEYDLTDEWTIGGGGNWLGHRFADQGNTANLPAYVILNAMASYKVTDNVTLQLNVNNITDKLYYDSSYYTSPAENHVIPGAGRTVTFSTSFAF